MRRLPFPFARSARALGATCALALTVLLGAGCGLVHRFTGPAPSPAAGTWVKGPLSLTLQPGGKGEEVIKIPPRPAATAPLDWTDKAGVVTVSIHRSDKNTDVETAQIAPDGHSLTVTSLSGGNSVFGPVTQPVHWHFDRKGTADH